MKKREKNNSSEAKIKELVRECLLDKKKLTIKYKQPCLASQSAFKFPSPKGSCGEDPISDVSSAAYNKVGIA